MLKVMRRSANSWVIKILLVFIALSFMVWGVGDYVNRENQRPVASGEGWAIHPREFSDAYDREFNTMRQRFGDALDKKTAEMLGLKQRTLNGLIDRHVLLVAGQQLGLSVSPHTLQKTIGAMAAFQSGGQFDAERYRQLLRNNQLTPAAFETQLVADIIVGQIGQIIRAGVAIPDILVQNLYRLENEKRVVETLTLQPKLLEDRIVISDEALTSYMQTHKDRFMTPARVKLHYVVLDAESVADSIQVTDSEINTFYNENQSDFVKEERRQASHILARHNSEEGDPLERIQQAQARLEKGEPFADVAKALSDDVSREKGGDLGEFTRGMMVPAFDEVAFSLLAGKVSQPVKTEFGYHLILVNAIHAAETKSLEQATEEIKKRLVALKSQDVVYERSTVLEDQIYVSSDLKSIAADLKIAYHETDFISRGVGKDLQGVEQDNKFLDAAFSLPVDEMSPLLEIKEGRFVALKVVAKKEPVLQSLEDVRGDVTRVYTNEKAHDKAEEIMENALKRLQEGKTWEEVAKIDAVIQTKVSEPFVHNGNKDAPFPAVRAASFKLTESRPVFQEVIKGLDSLVLLRLQKIIPADSTAAPEVIKALETKLQSTLGQEQMEAFLRGLRQSANIKIHSELLDRF